MTNVTAVCVQVPQLAFTEEERSRPAVLTVPKMRMGPLDLVRLSTEFHTKIL